MTEEGTAWLREVSGTWHVLFQEPNAFGRQKSGSIVPALDGMLFVRRLGVVLKYSPLQGLCEARAYDNGGAANGSGRYSFWLDDGRLLLADFFQGDPNARVPSRLVLLTPSGAE